MTFDEFKQKLPKEAPQKFTARYYGTRSLEVFPEAFMARVRECSQFIDITAGGGRFTYEQARLGKVVGANDRCFYSYCALFSVLSTFLIHRCTNPDWLKMLWDETDPEICCSIGHRGYLSALRTTYVNDRVRSYVDQICVTHQNDPFVLYCIGKALRSIFTYRGLGWCPATPFGIPSMAVSPEYIHHFLMKTAWTTSLYSKRTVTGQNEVFCCDALTAINRFKDKTIKGALVYADPSWPWVGGDKSNPYKWVTEDLSSILAQEKIEVSFWPKDEHKILAEISNWFRSSFSRGAKYFVLCNQDTNFPSLECTRDYLSSLTTPKLVKWIEVEDKSKAAHRSYKTAWGILQC